MRGLDPRIQESCPVTLALDGRVKPGHEGQGLNRSIFNRFATMRSERRAGSILKIQRENFPGVIV
jgi:hypothetical protein